MSNVVLGLVPGVETFSEGCRWFMFGGTGGVVMKPSEALEHHRDAIREATTRFNAANPRVFGSVARGEDRADSDLDILVDALPGTTLFDLGGLLEELKEVLGVNVDVVTSSGLPADIRERVLKEARAI